MLAFGAIDILWCWVVILVFCFVVFYSGFGSL